MDPGDVIYVHHIHTEQISYFERNAVVGGNPSEFTCKICTRGKTRAMLLLWEDKDKDGKKDS